MTCNNLIIWIVKRLMPSSLTLIKGSFVALTMEIMYHLNKIMTRITIALSMFFVILDGCKPDKNVNQSVLNDLAGGIISVEGTRFKYSFGRQVILSINHFN